MTEELRVWELEEPVLRDLLRRAAAGEDPDLLMLETWASAEVEDER